MSISGERSIKLGRFYLEWYWGDPSQWEWSAYRSPVRHWWWVEAGPVFFRWGWPR